MIKLSILVPTVPSRRKNFYSTLMDELERQTKGRTDIELLALYDNKSRTLGEKRQNMVELANGEFLVFIDDDDRVSSDYVELIMDKLSTEPDTDCVVFDCICDLNNEKKIHCKYGIEYSYNNNISGKGYWTGKPAHTMVYRAEIAKKHAFKSINYGEDSDWVIRACQDIKKQSRIDKVLYFYDFRASTSETRK